MVDKKEYKKQYYQKNKNRLDRINKEYRENNKEKCNDYSRQYMRLNWRKYNRKDNSATRKSHYVNLKEYFVNLKGGKCSICNGVFDLCCYDFHHIIPRKETGIKQGIPINFGGASKESIEKKLEGCILVCANCHRKITYNKAILI